MSLPHLPLSLKPAWRLVHASPSGAPLLDGLDPKGDLEALEALETLTRSKSDMRSKFVTRPFSNPRPSASRFTDGSYPVIYAAYTQDTALHEAAHHAALRAVGLPSGFIGYQVLHLKVTANLVDIQGLQAHPSHRVLYHPTSYNKAQDFAKSRHKAGEDGIAYDSVRRPGGVCLALFQAHAIQDCVHASFITLRWDGVSISI